MGQNMSVPPLNPAELILWALSSHLYQGLCPDELERWGTRDPNCVACYYTDRALRAMGYEVEPSVVEFDWDGPTRWEFDRNVGVARAMANDEVTYELLLRLMEEAALSSLNEYAGQNHLSFVVQQCRTDPALSPELRLRAEQLSTMYFMGEDLTH